MSSLRLTIISSGLLLLVCACLTTGAMASSVEYQFLGTNQQFFQAPDDLALFDLVVPSFITTTTTFTSWNSCAYDSFGTPDTCTTSTFTPGFVSGSNTYDALSLTTAGGRGFTDILFDPGTFGMYGSSVGQNNDSPQWIGFLTVSPAPEPAALVMLGSGLLSCLGWTRKRKQA